MYLQLKRDLDDLSNCDEISLLSDIDYCYFNKIDAMTSYINDKVLSFYDLCVYKNIHNNDVSIMNSILKIILKYNSNNRYDNVLYNVLYNYASNNYENYINVFYLLKSHVLNLYENDNEKFNNLISNIFHYLTNENVLEITKFLLENDVFYIKNKNRLNMEYFIDDENQYIIPYCYSKLEQVSYKINFLEYLNNNQKYLNKKIIFQIKYDERLFNYITKSTYNFNYFNVDMFQYLIINNNLNINHDLLYRFLYNLYNPEDLIKNKKELEDFFVIMHFKHIKLALFLVRKYKEILKVKELNESVMSIESDSLSNVVSQFFNFTILTINNKIIFSEDSLGNNYIINYMLLLEEIKIHSIQSYNNIIKNMKVYKDKYDKYIACYENYLLNNMIKSEKDKSKGKKKI